MKNEYISTNSPGFLNDSNRRLRNSNNRSNILQEIITSAESQERKEKRQKELFNTHGSKKYEEEGMLTRLFGISIVDFSKLSDADKTSFKYGYYEISNNQLNVMCTSGMITERIRKDIAKIAKEEDTKLYMQDILYSTGYRDAGDSNIVFDKLPLALQQNKYYIEGFEQGLHEAYHKGGR